ncbi:hypothetical protein RCH09_003777 [Actimicrobium sp. GrIS 1.19]|uniref:DUF262 domain-containing protein n=1 Tax=Actimicrobium sp. GrIS 1.19 TaxID=3071708 RepID=UPI002DF82B60|nr:hypothetical protein [Actimicrobium sp. GrIS 1.19]
MKPYTRSIIELFDGKKRYLIPLYQRQYAWKIKPQLEFLWEDIERAVHSLTTNRVALSPHFMGALVVMQLKTYGKEVQAFEIIDGQQRLTTFELLLAALRDVAIANNSRYADELRKYLLNDGVMQSPQIECFKLWPSLTDRRAFVSIVDPSADLDAVAPKPNNEDSHVYRSTVAHAFFKEKVESHVLINGKFEEYRFETLFEALKEGLAVVSIELESGDDPQTIFETLNSRGIDLTAADLMRNFIFQRAKGLGQTNGVLVIDKLYEKHWHPLDGSFWIQEASRGRQKRSRLDWMLTDHLSMQVGDLISVESLFENYRRWILSNQPFPTVEAELESITLTAGVETRLFAQKKGDPLGDFGRFADAFDVSTAMPLVLYLATEADIENDLSRGLGILKSYILRRDICGLTTKNYNRLFVGLISRLRVADGNKVDEMFAYLSSRQSDTDRWPDDSEWEKSWMSRDQYKTARQPRLRFLFESIELEKRTALNEDIEIKSDLTIEHIMPRSWQENWPILGFEYLDEGDIDRNLDYLTKQSEREVAVNKIGNLTLLTGSLNTLVSNGPYSVKMPAVRSHSSLALNRELNKFEDWDEISISKRGQSLFSCACKIWEGPDHQTDISFATSNWSSLIKQSAKLPPDGTLVRFTYFGKLATGKVVDGDLYVDGMEGKFSSLSSASSAITGTSRNGWNDWYLLDEQGNWTLANEWRQLAAHAA